MSYPEELLYLFPNIQYLPDNIIDVFLKNKAVAHLIDAINEKKQADVIVSCLKFIGVIPELLPQASVKSIFDDNLVSSSQTINAYRWAMIGLPMPEADHYLETRQLQPLLDIYATLHQSQMKKDRGLYQEAIGGFEKIDALNEEIDKLKENVAEIRRSLCLFHLGSQIKAMEIDRICQQYPLLSGIKERLQVSNEDDFYVQIQAYHQQCFVNSLPGVTLAGLQAQEDDLSASLTQAIKADDNAIFDNQANIFRQFVDTSVEAFLTDINPNVSSTDLQSVQSFLSNLAQTILNHADNCAQTYHFLQYSGFGSQSDFFFADLYTAIRQTSNTAHYKQIFASLLKPFDPIVKEYELIGLYETNPVSKIFRAVMPLLIVAATIVIISALLAPLGLPEIAFAAVFIPALIIGLSLASFYCKIKDDLFQTVRESFYGDQFKLPEFQLNRRMLEIFSDPSLADMVRQFYVHNLRICKEVEQKYARQAAESGMSDRDKAAAEENLTYLRALLKQWHDIHENKAVTYNQVVKIVAKQFAFELNRDKKRLTDYINQEHCPERAGWQAFADRACSRDIADIENRESRPFVSQLGIFKLSKQGLDNLEAQYQPLFDLNTRLNSTASI